MSIEFIRENKEFQHLETIDKWQSILNIMMMLPILIIGILIATLFIYFIYSKIKLFFSREGEREYYELNEEKKNQ